ncbi:alpha/beta hydrolase [Chromobacterium phragmitis]|uniref:alpha/beta fold hydrolase n=1 Tax=Chromobacterium amazonense TaxID=1382803 RepID=UPI0021B6F3DC|nr:alpha/beta hydrolase [Chromobacterium amazonense]MBM2883293.1 alpha/beta hydrolase [Chromobacterium amazonense]
MLKRIERLLCGAVFFASSYYESANQQAFFAAATRCMAKIFNRGLKMENRSTLHTESGVRLRRVSNRPGRHNWLLLPGGPGLGSESLASLASCLDVDGAVWLVDLPGDGNNTGQPEDYRRWPGVIREAACALPHCVFVGHSTGGMYLLSTPELEPLLQGLVLISSAPDARWQSRFARTSEQYPLPELGQAFEAYSQNPSAETLKGLTLAAAPWNFSPASLASGRAMLKTLSYNVAAMEWSGQHFDAEYQARWWPSQLPVLILSGSEDRIVDQSLWQDSAYQGANVRHAMIEGAEHFPWFEAPDQVAAEFAQFAERLT